jgi:hypothetical protein
VSPEPELTIARSAPQGMQRKQVEQGSISELLAETNGPHTTSELSYFLVISFKSSVALVKPSLLIHVLPFRHEALFRWRQAVSRACPEHVQCRPENHAD